MWSQNEVVVWRGEEVGPSRHFLLLLEENAWPSPPAKPKISTADIFLIEKVRGGGLERPNPYFSQSTRIFPKLVHNEQRFLESRGLIAKPNPRPMPPLKNMLAILSPSRKGRGGGRGF